MILSKYKVGDLIMTNLMVDAATRNVLRVLKSLHTPPKCFTHPSV